VMKNQKILLLGIVIVFLLFLVKSIYKQPTIIGYFHVCQMGEWRRSFDLSMDTLKRHGLLDATQELRIGVLSKDGFEDDKRFHHPKIKIIYTGKVSDYERPTLLHMKQSSLTDPSDTKYYYLHTKGIRHFNTKNEEAIVTWIKSMLYWNFVRWRDAVSILDTHETYGCHYLTGRHYSGNFWWATAEHIQKLPDTIHEHYNGPEDWILKNDDRMYCAYNCGDDFIVPYPKDLY